MQRSSVCRRKEAFYRVLFCSQMGTAMLWAAVRHHFPSLPAPLAHPLPLLCCPCLFDKAQGSTPDSWISISFFKQYLATYPGTFCLHGHSLIYQQPQTHARYACASSGQMHASTDLKYHHNVLVPQAEEMGCIALNHYH